MGLTPDKTRVSLRVEARVETEGGVVFVKKSIIFCVPELLVGNPTLGSLAIM